MPTRTLIGCHARAGQVSRKSTGVGGSTCVCMPPSAFVQGARVVQLPRLQLHNTVLPVAHPNSRLRPKGLFHAFRRMRKGFSLLF